MDDRNGDPRRLERRDFSQAGAVLGRAFYGTDQWAAVIPSEKIRQRKLQQMFSGTLKTAAVAGGLSERTGGFEAVSVWMPPGRSFGFGSMVRSGFASAWFAITPPMLNVRRMTSMLLQFEEEHKRRMPDAHWYLMALGVDPQCQGQGHGSVLVRNGVRRAADDGVPAYLETETGPNVAFYQRHGFEPVAEVVIDAYQLPMTLMASHA